MLGPHPLTLMKEWEWSQLWEEQQRTVDHLHDKRGSWLPNVVEKRRWGVMRWTSGRPAHAASSGQAVAETFAVFQPGVEDPDFSDEVAEALRDHAPSVQFFGVGLQRHQMLGAAIGAGALAVLTGVILALVGVGPLWLLLGILLAACAGAVLGVSVARYVNDQRRKAVLDDQVRVVTGRYAPNSWTRLVEAATAVEWAAADSTESSNQAIRAAHEALWEAAVLLLRSSDHTGVEVLADGMERLAQAHR